MATLITGDDIFCGAALVVNDHVFSAPKGLPAKSVTLGVIVTEYVFS